MITSRSAFPHPRLWFETTAKRARICPHGSPMPPFVTPATRRDWLWLPKPPECHLAAGQPLVGQQHLGRLDPAPDQKLPRADASGPVYNLELEALGSNCPVHSGQGRDHRDARPERRGITLASTTPKVGLSKPLRASRSGRAGSGRVGATLAALPGWLSCVVWPDWPRQEVQALDFGMIGPMI